MTTAEPARRTSTRRPSKSQDHSIVAIDKFIQATRDSGYKGTASAIAELVDNSIQAGARTIEILIDRSADDPRHPIEVTVCDDGCGMDPLTLRQALRFGGSSRFNDRSGLGRYGMGLPNSSLSQARRVTVTSWVKPGAVYSCALDVDEIAGGLVTEVPVPWADDYPYDAEEQPRSGTIVAWTRCDRLDNRRISTLAKHLDVALGRRFRCFLWEDLSITINGEAVAPIDPLFIHPEGRVSGAKMFGEPIAYEVRVGPDDGNDATGVVEVTFSELPVAEWHGLSNEDKRSKGISKGAGVSVVRGHREVDHGWFFMGSKRRENYDDWWRCEVRFDPILDEAFGITHTKQQIRPQAHLLDALVPDLEATARALNSRARREHLKVKLSERASKAEKVAAKNDHKLKPLPTRITKRDREVLAELKRFDPSLRVAASDREGMEYRVMVARTPTKQSGDAFFDGAHEQGRLVAAINPDHPFYRRVYRRLEGSEDPRDHDLRTALELMLLSFAREAARCSDEGRKVLERFKRSWSDALATLLNGQ